MGKYQSQEQEIGQARVLNLCRYPITMNSVLDLFSVSLLATNQSLMLERSWFRLHSIRSGSLSFSTNLRSGVIFFLLLCFFGSRGKKITDYRDKGRGHDRRLGLYRQVSTPPISISHRLFRCRYLFKLQRRSCKLSFLFPPHRLSVPESLPLAG